MFALSCVTVLAAIASLAGFVNLLGPPGFVIGGAIPIVLFTIGSIFVPLVCDG